MKKKAPILDGDDSALQVGRNIGERNIVTLLVQTKPRLPVGRKKCRIADSASQASDRSRIPRHFPDDRYSSDAEHDDDRENQPSAETRRPEAHCPSFFEYSAVTSSSIFDSFRFSSRRP